MDVKAESVKHRTRPPLAITGHRARGWFATPRTVSRTDFGIYSEDGDHKPEVLRYAGRGQYRRYSADNDYAICLRLLSA